MTMHTRTLAPIITAKIRVVMLLFVLVLSKSSVVDLRLLASPDWLANYSFRLNCTAVSYYKSFAVDTNEYVD